MEHRCGYRRSVSIPAQVITGEGLKVQVEVRNISASGAWVRSPSSLPLDARIVVQFATHDSSRQRPTVLAQVVRRNEEGVGLEWTEFSPDPIRRLLRQLSLERARHEGRAPRRVSAVHGEHVRN